MTKDMYFDMCEMLGNEPIEEEIPIEFADFPLDVQEAYSVYAMLQDTWDYMSGTYVGKNYSGFNDILNIKGIEDKQTTISIILLLDRIRKEVIDSSKPKNPST